MPAAPQWKVYNPQGEYVAACKHAEDAAALIALYGKGATIRDSSHRHKLWVEGIEQWEAADSYDRVLSVVTERSKGRLYVGP